MGNNRLRQLGLNIKFARIRKGMSQETLAELCETSRTTISMIETARQNPTILKVIDIASALNIDVSEIINSV